MFRIGGKGSGFENVKSRTLIRKLAVTHAAVSDSTVFETLLDPSNTSRDVYADSG